MGRRPTDVELHALDPAHALTSMTRMTRLMRVTSLTRMTRVTRVDSPLTLTLGVCK